VRARRPVKDAAAAAKDLFLNLPPPSPSGRGHQNVSKPRGGVDFGSATIAYGLFLSVAAATAAAAVVRTHTQIIIIIIIVGSLCVIIIYFFTAPLVRAFFF